MNTIEFLKNYNNFAYKVRHQTAKTFLERLRQSSNEDERRVMMLKIVEELIASTEDLAMWYLAVKRRSNRPWKTP